LRRVRTLALAAAVLASAAQAQSGAAGVSATSGFCDRVQPMTAPQEDRALRFAAAVRKELEASPGGAAIISRSGLDLSRFHIRYSHAAVALRADTGAWSTRQLFYACDESRPRLFDQGVAGFALGIDDPSLGFVSIVRLPAGPAQSLRAAALQAPVVLGLLAARYSANAYPFSLLYQNGNQWVAELLALAWSGPPVPDEAGADGLRAQAQRRLREAGYAPAQVDVGSHALMFGSTFVPFVHLGDHPEEDRFALKLRVSLPSSIEGFVHDHVPGSERVELCHDGHRVVVHTGWSPIAAGCVRGEGDRVVALDEAGLGTGAPP